MTPSPADRPPAALSVVLCTWNGARWLPDLLRSLAGQDRLPDELVVQDDASADDTLAVVEAFAEDAPFAVRIERNGQRVGSTRNFGRALLRATGDVVALADQDDVWYPEKVAIVEDEFAADPTVTMVFSDADLLDEAGNPLGPRLWATRRLERTLRTRPVVGVADFARRPLTTGCTMAVRRRVLEAALPLPGVLDDDDFPMRHDRWLSLMAAAVGTARALPEPLLGFRVHPGQQTGVLVGPAKTAAAKRSVSHVLRATSTAREHDVRAAQIGVAATRADDLGDFASARQLRALERHHRNRAAVARGRSSFTEIARHARQGHYGVDGVGLGAVVADLYRQIRHR